MKWSIFPSFFQKSPLKVIGSENIRNLPDASATKPTLKKSPNNKTKHKTDPNSKKGEGVVTGRGRPTPCPYCQKIFSRSDVIRPHIMAVHPGEKVPIRVTSSPVVPPSQTNKNKKKPPAAAAAAAKTVSKDKAKSKNKSEAAASKKKKEMRRSEPPGMNAFHGRVIRPAIYSAFEFVSLVPVSEVGLPVYRYPIYLDLRYGTYQLYSAFYDKIFKGTVR
jgi:hypothetical protein